jgi:hypothetical protein
LPVPRHSACWWRAGYCCGDGVVSEKNLLVLLRI